MTVKPFLQRILQQEPSVFNNVRIWRLCQPKHTIYCSVFCNFAHFEPYEHGHYHLEKCNFLLDNDAQLWAIDCPPVFLYILRH